MHWNKTITKTLKILLTFAFSFYQESEMEPTPISKMSQASLMPPEKKVIGTFLHRMTFWDHLLGHLGNMFALLPLVGMSSMFKLTQKSIYWAFRIKSTRPRKPRLETQFYHLSPSCPEASYFTSLNLFLQLFKGVMRSLKKMLFISLLCAQYCSILWSNVLNLLFHYWSSKETS